MIMIGPCAWRVGQRAEKSHCKENSIMFKNVTQGLGLGWILLN
jgi:hypothetical protein